MLTFLPVVSFSVVVPTYNMADHIEPLWQSMVSSGLAEHAAEILIVNDGSNDGTRECLDRLRNASQLASAKLRAVHLEQNVGRFFARLEGSRRAVGDDVLFLDSRLTLPDNFAAKLAQARQEYPCIVGSIDLDTSRNRFCLYWDRSHRFVFRRHFSWAHAPIVLTPANFDEFLSGTTVFMCPTDIFVAACAHFEHAGLLSDDTFLMKRIVAVVPIAVHPDVRVGWVPRETFAKFVWRIWDRGPGFVEYRVIAQRGGMYFWIVLGGLLLCLSVGCLVATLPIVGVPVMLVGLSLIPLSTALLAKNPREFVQLAPLHTAVVAAFAAGIVRGLIVNLGRMIRDGSVREVLVSASSRRSSP